MAKVRKREWSNAKGEKKLAYVVDYMDADGTRRTPQFEKKHQANDFLRKVQRELEDGTHQASSQTVTVADACKRFLIYSEGRVNDGRIGKTRMEALRSSIRASIVPKLGGLKLTDITPLRVEQFHDELVSKDRYAVNSAKARLQALMQVYDLAIKHGLAKVNPVPAAKKALRGQTKAVNRFFTQDEAGRLLSAAAVCRSGDVKHTHKTVNLSVNLAAFCCLRFGEIMGLTLDNVDLHTRTIKVRHSLSYHDGLKGPKSTAGVRDVPMPTHVVALMRDYLENNLIDNKDNRIFSNFRGGTLGAGTLNNVHWPKLLERAGLLDGGPKLHFHGLRHFCISWWIAQGMPITDVARLAGHSKVDMTLSVYAHSISRHEAKHEAVERMSRALIAAPLTLDAA